MRNKSGNWLIHIALVVVAVVLTSVAVAFLPDSVSRYKQLIFFLGIPAITVLLMALQHLVMKFRKK